MTSEQAVSRKESGPGKAGEVDLREQGEGVALAVFRVGFVRGPVGKPAELAVEQAGLRLRQQFGFERLAAGVFRDPFEDAVQELFGQPVVFGTDRLRRVAYAPKGF